MSEQRKSNRLELNSTVMIKLVSEVESVEFPIKILDVSKIGIGFEYNESLKMGHIYEGNVTIWTQEVIHMFIEIVRIKQVGDSYIYGAIFIGMPELVTSRITVYEMFEESKKGEV